MKLSLAYKELKTDLDLKKIYLLGKITGKNSFYFYLKNLSYNLIFIFIIGIVKDYFLAMATHNEKNTIFWCSSSSWVFSEMPKLLEDPNDLEKLRSVNNLFTGEFDSVLFPGSGAP